MVGRRAPGANAPSRISRAVTARTDSEVCGVWVPSARTSSVVSGSVTDTPLVAFRTVRRIRVFSIYVFNGAVVLPGDAFFVPVAARPAGPPPGGLSDRATPS